MNLLEFKEIINEMADEYPEAEVIISKDEGGNVYSPLDICSIGMYLPENTFYGSFFTKEDNADDDDYNNYNHHDDYEENAIVLWPMS